MIFADKIILLRKQNGWNQEQFAEQLGVSRQAVSKWEMGQGYPEVEKLLLLSSELNISLDYFINLFSENGSLLQK